MKQFFLLLRYPRFQSESESKIFNKKIDTPWDRECPHRFKVPEEPIVFLNRIHFVLYLPRLVMTELS